MKKQKRSRGCSRNRRLTFESLEGRQLLAADGFSLALEGNLAFGNSADRPAVLERCDYDSVGFCIRQEGTPVSPTWMSDAPPVLQGESASSLRLGTGNEYLVLHDTPAQQSFTLHGFVKPLTAQKDGIIIGYLFQSNGANNPAGFDVGVQNGYLRLEFAINNQWVRVGTGAVLPANEWSHIALRIVDGKGSLFLNGTSIREFTLPGSIDFDGPGLTTMPGRYGARMNEVMELFGASYDNWTLGESLSDDDIRAIAEGHASGTQSVVEELQVTEGADASPSSEQEEAPSATVPETENSERTVLPDPLYRYEGEPRAERIETGINTNTLTGVTVLHTKLMIHARGRSAIASGYIQAGNSIGTPTRWDFEYDTEEDGKLRLLQHASGTTLKTQGTFTVGDEPEIVLVYDWPGRRSQLFVNGLLEGAATVSLPLGTGEELTLLDRPQHTWENKNAVPFFDVYTDLSEEQVIALVEERVGEAVEEEEEPPTADIDPASIIYQSEELREYRGYIRENIPDPDGRLVAPQTLTAKGTIIRNRTGDDASTHDILVSIDHQTASDKGKAGWSVGFRYDKAYVLAAVRDEWVILESEETFMEIGRPYELQVTVDGATREMKLYVDGRLVAETVLSGALDYASAGARGSLIAGMINARNYAGQNGLGGEPANVQVGNIMILDVVRTPEEFGRVNRNEEEEVTAESSAEAVDAVNETEVAMQEVVNVDLVPTTAPLPVLQSVENIGNNYADEVTLSSGTIDLTEGPVTLRGGLTGEQYDVVSISVRSANETLIDFSMALTYNNVGMTVYIPTRVDTSQKVTLEGGTHEFSFVLGSHNATLTVNGSELQLPIDGIQLIDSIVVSGRYGVNLESLALLQARLVPRDSLSDEQLAELSPSEVGTMEAQETTNTDLVSTLPKFALPDAVMNELHRQELLDKIAQSEELARRRVGNPLIVEPSSEAVESLVRQRYPELFPEDFEAYTSSQVSTDGKTLGQIAQDKAAKRELFYLQHNWAFKAVRESLIARNHNINLVIREVEQAKQRMRDEISRNAEWRSKYDDQMLELIIEDAGRQRASEINGAVVHNHKARYYLGWESYTADIGGLLPRALPDDAFRGMQEMEGELRVVREHFAGLREVVQSLPSLNLPELTREDRLRILAELNAKDESIAAIPVSDVFIANAGIDDELLNQLVTQAGTDDSTLERLLEYAANRRAERIEEISGIPAGSDQERLFQEFLAERISSELHAISLNEPQLSVPMVSIIASIELAHSELLNQGYTLSIFGFEVFSTGPLPGPAGCGSYNSGWIPDRILGLDFSTACQLHDEAWSGDPSVLVQFLANEQFYVDMITENSNTVWQRLHASVIARLYADSVHLEALRRAVVSGFDVLFGNE